MKIYTSYFGNWRALKNENIMMIGVSRFPPTYFKGQTMLELAPLSNMLKMEDKEYDRVYAKKILGITNQKKIIKEIEKLAKYTNATSVALCCFEKEQKECHRFNIAEWLNKTGLDVQEFKKKEEAKVKVKTVKKKEQLSLF